jgi:transcriptional regulator with XRE-family HTH domain
VSTDVEGTSMTWSPGPVVTRRRLGAELKRLRDRSGLKLEDVARRLECSPSKISRLENGKGIPKSRDVRDMLDVYGIDDAEQRERLLEWAETGKQPMWWSDYADVLPLGLDTYVEYEWDAARICAYESHLVHGLLQTRDYAEAILGTWHPSRSQRDLDRMVEVRLRRQEALAEDHGLQFRCVLDESTLYRAVGSPDVLRGQLEHLIDAAAAEHVDLRILPFSAGLVAGNLGPFAKLEFSEGLEEGLVHVEGPDGTTSFADDPMKLAEYEKRMEKILGAALSEKESVPLIKRAIGLTQK